MPKNCICYYCINNNYIIVFINYRNNHLMIINSLDFGIQHLKKE